MSEQMMSRAPRRMTDEERPFWNTVARLYREYGTEDTAVSNEPVTVDEYLNGPDDMTISSVIVPDNEPAEHYHVVEFIDGCLNDYDSGPMATIDEARATLTGIAQATDGYAETGADDELYTPAGEDRYTRGSYILKIETCRENCDETEG